MPYELRLPGQPPAVYATESEGMAAVRKVLADNPDAEPELFDTATGQPCAPAASKGWRDALRGEVGF